jgi:hypothetical protein
MVVRRVLAGLLGGIAFSGSAATGSEQTDLQPAEIFRQAQTAWGGGFYPRFADYDVVVRYRNGAKVIQRTWITTEDIRHGTVTSRTFAREELSNPPAPTGINVAIPFFPGHKDPEPVGQVAFAINQDFGLAPYRQRFAYQPPFVMEEERNTLVVIGRTGTNRPRDYDVRLLGTDEDAGRSVLHLGLTPRNDPWRHRLRELSLDEATLHPIRAIVSGIGSRSPLTETPWVVTFREDGGAEYLSALTALKPVSYGGNGTMTDFTVEFTNVRLESRPADELALTIAHGTAAQNVQTEP